MVRWRERERARAKERGGEKVNTRATTGEVKEEGGKRDNEKAKESEPVGGREGR